MAEKQKISAVGRLSFPSLYAARAYKEGQKKKYDCNLLYSPEDQKKPEVREKLQEMIAEADAAARKLWPTELGPEFTFAKESTIPKWLKEDHRPFKTDDDGNVIFPFKSVAPPAVVGTRKLADGKYEPLSEESGRVYAGCYGRVSYSAYAYANEAKGVKLGLGNFQKVADGEPFSARTAAEDDFEGYEGADDLADADALFA